MMSQYNESPRAPEFSWRHEMARLADDLPWAQAAARGLAESQKWALVELKQRLAAVEAESAANEPVTARDELTSRLAAASGVDPEAAREQLHHRTVAQLLPDEALMFARLMRTGEAPLAHVVVARWPMGRARWTALENASTLGRDAGIILADRVCEYVATLRRLHLCQVEPAAGRLDDGFELLQAETNVRESLDGLRNRRGAHPRLARYLLTPSAYGRTVWAHCGPSSD